MTKEKTKTNQAKEKKNVKRPVEPVVQQPVDQFEGFQPQTLQRAVTNPALATPSDILTLGRRYGNRAVQRLLRRGSGEGFALDSETAGRITKARGGGKPIESSLRNQMGAHMGYDFSGVRVHTGLKSDELNRKLNARAFTTGQDIFFRHREYNPASASGRELIAHELSHVVQQGTGRVRGSTRKMTVRPAGDALEQEAQSAAISATRRSGNTQRAGAIQRALADHITPAALEEEHGVVELEGNKLKIRINADHTQDMLCVTAVALATQGDRKHRVDDVSDLLDLQSAVTKAAGGGAEVNQDEYKVPNKVVHWMRGGTHKHSAVVTSSGLAAGYNQGDHVSGGKTAGDYNVGKIKWPEGVTVRLTD